jgi:hypothetical protein
MQHNAVRLRNKDILVTMEVRKGGRRGLENQGDVLTPLGPYASDCHNARAFVCSCDGSTPIALTA